MIRDRYNIFIRLIRHDIFNLTVGKYVSLGVQLLIIFLITNFYGTFTLGVWGFSKLILQILNYADFGLQFSTPVLISQNLENKDFQKNLFTKSIVIVGSVAIVIIAAALLIFIGEFTLFQKYNFASYVILLAIVASLHLINKIYLSFYRCIGGLRRVSFFNYFTHLPVLFSFFVATEENFMIYALGFLAVGHVIAMLNFVRGKELHFSNGKSVTFPFLLRQGLHLTYFNLGLRLMPMAFLFIYSRWFTVEEFGFLTLANNLAEGLVLGISSVNFALLPRLISSFGEENKSVALEKVKKFTILNNNILFSFFAIVAVAAQTVLYFFGERLLPAEIDVIHILFLLFLISYLIKAIATGFINYYLARNRGALLGHFALISVTTVVIVTLSLKNWYTSELIVLTAVYILSTILFYLTITVYYQIKALEKLSYNRDFYDTLLVFFISTILVVQFDSSLPLILLLIIYSIINFKKFRSSIKIAINKLSF